MYDCLQKNQKQNLRNDWQINLVSDSGKIRESISGHMKKNESPQHSFTQANHTCPACLPSVVK